MNGGGEMSLCAKYHGHTHTDTEKYHKIKEAYHKVNESKKIFRSNPYKDVLMKWFCSYHT